MSRARSSRPSRRAIHAEYHRARWRCEAFAPFVIEAIIDAGDKMYVHEK